MADINRLLLINYKRIFDSSNENYIQDISSLDKNTWFKILANFNFLLRNNKNPEIVDVLSRWFRYENNEYANGLYQKIQKVYGTDVNVDKTTTLLNVWTNLTLLDNLLKQKENNEQDVNEVETEKKLFNAYLTTNEFFTERTNELSEELGNPGAGPVELLDWYAKYISTTLLPHNDISNPNLVELWIIQFVKSCFCFEYFEKDHPELLAVFFKKYNIRDWKEYLKAIMPLVDHAVFHNENGLGYISIKDAENKEKLGLFLDSLSISSDIIYEVKTDFIHARSNPIFKIDDKTYLVIDAVLIINKLYNSVFFEMLRIITDNKISVKPYKNFFQLYTTEFIEHYISYKLLNKIYEKKQLYKISGQEIKEQCHTEPDYYVRNGNKVFLYEIKGSIITGDAKQSFKYCEVQKELIKKYYYDDKDGQKKAIKQLIGRIEILFAGNAIYDPNYNPKTIKIYPILLVSEVVLMTPGINYILNSWFQKEILNSELLNANQSRVFNLIIMDIDSMILYSDQFQKDKNLMENMINGYYQQTNISRISPPPGTIKNENDLENVITNMLVPFTFYLRKHLKNATPSLFSEYAKSIFHNSRSN